MKRLLIMAAVLFSTGLFASESSDQVVLRCNEQIVKAIDDTYAARFRSLSIISLNGAKMEEEMTQVTAWLNVDLQGQKLNIKVVLRVDNKTCAVE